MAELAEELVQFALELRHAGVGLFHDGQRDRVASVGEDRALPFAGVFDHLRQVPDTEEPSVDLQEDPFDVLPVGQHRAELHAVLVLAVADREAAQRDVGPLEGAFDRRDRDACLPQFRLVRDDEDFGRHAAAHVHHRHLGQLFDALGDDLRGEAAQGREPLRYGVQLVLRGGGAFVPDGEVDVEGRDVGGAGLDDLRALQVAGQRGDRTVDLLVHFDEQVVDVRPLLEGEADDGAAFAGVAADVRKLRELDELPAEGYDDRLVQLARRDALRRNLDGDVGRVYVGHERHGQQAAAHDAQDDQDDGDHRHGDGPVEKSA